MEKTVKGKRVVVIGSGFGGLGTACLMAKAGADVTVYEKNEMVGGRASVFEAEGFRFDMGPSWYLMPDVFEQFFTLLGERVEDHLDLRKLSPSYRIFFKDTEKQVDIFSDLEKDRGTIESLEEGSSKQLEIYLDLAARQYAIARDKFMYKNYDTVLDFFTWDVMTEGRKLSVFTNMQKYVERFFKTPELQKIVQYPLVFLGSSPYNTPALYNIMSHIDFNMGVYYPMGGMYEIVKSLRAMAESYGATFHVNTEVRRIVTEDGIATGVELADATTVPADIVVSNADIHHTETSLLAEADRSFSDRYWEKRTLSPSALILYLGVEGRVPELVHHNLLFSLDWEKNFGEIFDDPQWPDDPSYYVCAPSVTDDTVAPEGKENLFVLVPIASGLEYDEAFLANYKEKILKNMEEHMGIERLRERIVFERTFCVKDFESRYYSYRGSALGLAHTFKQTAIFRPDTKSKKVKNLYYVGGNTNPGIGMPICLISSQLVYKRVTGDRAAGPLKKL